MTRLDPSWLKTLDLSQLSRERGGTWLSRALQHRFEYVEPPTLVRGVVHGKLRDQDGAETETEVHPPRASSYYSGIGETRCNCGAQYFACEHAEALCIDLALMPRFRDALLEGKTPPPLLDQLPALRAAAFRDHLALEALRAWAPRSVRNESSDEVVRGPLEYGLSFHDISDAHAFRYGQMSVPLLDVRPRVPGARSILDDKERTEHQFPPADTQVLRLLRPIHGRKGFYAEGAAASLVLEVLRPVPITLEDDGSPIHYDEEPVLLRLATTRMPRHRIGARATRVPHPHRTPHASDDGEAKSKPEPDQHPLPALEARFFTRSGSLDVPSSEVLLFAGQFPHVWVPERRRLYRLHPSTDISAAFRLFLVPSIELVEGYAPRLLRSIRQDLQPLHVVMPPAADIGLLPAERPRFALRIGGQPLNVTARLEAEYSFGLFALGGTSSDLAESTRDIELESAAADLLRATSLRHDPASDHFVAQGNAAAEFWLTHLDELRTTTDPELELMVPEQLAPATRKRQLRVRFRVSVEGGLLDLNASATADSTGVPLHALRRAVATGERWVVLEDGTLTEITSELADLVEDATELLGDAASAKLPAHQIGRVEKWVESEAADVTLDASVVDVRERLRALDVAAEPPLPQGLDATLRPYQLQGVAWLQLLAALGVGGVLADDMGLGKTLMALTLIAGLRESAGRGEPGSHPGPVLVVCPTSVATNWIREAQHFTPRLTTALFHGGERDIEAAQAADLVVTTYAILRLDNAALAACEFSCVVFDEAQNVKNARTATARAARLVPARMKLALSGTPVENHLAELWAVLDLVAPGLLSTRPVFARRFEGPVTADPRGAAAKRLQTMIRPFVLRRTKRQVLAELPPKQEITQRIVLGPEQRRLYDALVGVVRDEAAEGPMAILKGLLRLRQLACDPRLVDRALLAAPSAKRDAFIETVRELVAAGRRALVFSQFVELLSLWRRDLDREAIAYEYLDGSTRDREAVVDRFQHGDAPLFLISLKAGGAGLNLTAADTVILCDPWWNPAVESQATDRAHRIGQTRPVTVIRLVAAGTVEERIQELGSRKRELAESVIGDDAGALRGLSAEDLASLLGTATNPEFEVTEESFVEAEGAPLPTVEGPSLLDGAGEEELAALRTQLEAYLEKTGKKQRDLARLTSIPSHYVGHLLRGKPVRLSMQEVQRARTILAEALIPGATLLSRSKKAPRKASPSARPKRAKTASQRASTKKKPPSGAS